MTPKPEDICSKHPFNTITKCEGVIDYKLIREIHCKIQANTSTIQSELGGGQSWFPWSGNTTIHITNCNWAIFPAPGPYPTSSSSDNRCGFSWNTKVHPASCSPSGSMAPNGICGIYPEAANFRITGGELLQGATPGIHQLCQLHTCGTHPEPLSWSWDHITNGYRGEWVENESIMAASRTNGGTFLINWRRSGVCRGR